jgi:hypothetical protein
MGKWLGLKAASGPVQMGGVLESKAAGRLKIIANLGIRLFLAH